MNGNTSEYYYDALGVKRKAVYYTSIDVLEIPLGDVSQEFVDNGENVSECHSTDYCGHFIYEGSLLRKVLTPEGYLEPTTYYSRPDASKPGVFKTCMTHNFFLRDHLGNTRAQLKQYMNYKDLSGFYIADTKDYYAFGLEHGKPWDQYYGSSTTTTNPYLYNGKEMDRMHGLNQLDYGARWYDASLGRFSTSDPDIEDAYHESPYAMCDNNMVNRVDPDGRFWNYVAGGVAGGLMEIGTQVVANAITGSDQSINWKKVGVSIAEGALTSGGSVALKVGATVGAAFAQSALDGNTGIKNLAIGAAVNLGSGAVGSGASKLAKGVGEKGLEKVANKMVGSKTAITKTVKNLTNTSAKNARVVAKIVQNAEKAAAKEVREANQSAAKSATSGVASGVYESDKKKNP